MGENPDDNHFGNNETGSERDTRMQYDAFVRSYFRPIGITNDDRLLSLLNAFLETACTSLIDAYKAYVQLPMQKQMDFAPFVFTLYALEDRIDSNTSDYSFRVRRLVEGEQDLDAVYHEVGLSQGGYDILSDICLKFNLQTVPRTHALVAEFLEMEPDDPDIVHEALALLHDPYGMEELEQFIRCRQPETRTAEQQDTWPSDNAVFNDGNIWEPTYDPEWGAEDAN